MTPFWQHIIVIAALVLAGGYLVWYFVEGRKAEPGCKSCAALNALNKKKSESQKSGSN